MRRFCKYCNATVEVKPVTYECEEFHGLSALEPTGNIHDDRGACAEEIVDVLNKYGFLLEDGTLIPKP